ncbi:MAG: hypothetical protein E6K10_07100 [Methanobacteriota archaeon]|nr:MAG: hypothetical protein E6K10_07100 [Euryarchaeota archaeon]
MNVSIEVGHPAHVHYWRWVRQGLLDRGHRVSVLARGKETTFRLLDALGIPFVEVGRNYPTIVGKGLGMFANSWDVLREATREGVDMMLSGGMPYSAQASAILDVPHLAIIDTEHASLTLAATIPFTDVVCTPACFRRSFRGPKHARFRGYVESMYLRPEHFTPRMEVLDRLGLEAGTPFSVVRFSSWDSSHDMFAVRTGLETVAGRERLVRELEAFGPVFVSSEVPLPASMERFRLTLPLEDIHSLLHYAWLSCGEGAKMAAEAGVLGTPWLYIAPVGRSYLDEQESAYGLGRTVGDLGSAIAQARAWLGMPDLKKEWAKKRERLISDTVDVTQFVLREIDELARRDT